MGDVESLPDLMNEDLGYDMRGKELFLFFKKRRNCLFLK